MKPDEVFLDIDIIVCRFFYYFCVQVKTFYYGRKPKAQSDKGCSG